MYVTYTRIYGWSDYGGESSYQPGYRLENMMWMTLLVYDYIIPGEKDTMKGFPKVLKTAQDVKNCKDMVDAGQLQAADLLEAIEAIENQNFIICPIRELSEDKKTVTVTYCNEAAAGAKVTAGGVTATIQSVEHIDGEPDGSGKAEKEKTKITLSRTIAAGSETIKIANTPSVYDTLGMTEEELEAIKADLQQ